MDLVLVLQSPGLVLLGSLVFQEVQDWDSGPQQWVVWHQPSIGWPQSRDRPSESDEPHLLNSSSPSATLRDRQEVRQGDSRTDTCSGTPYPVPRPPCASSQGNWASLTSSCLPVGGVSSPPHYRHNPTDRWVRVRNTPAELGGVSMMRTLSSALGILSTQHVTKTTEDSPAESWFYPLSLTVEQQNTCLRVLKCL